MESTPIALLGDVHARIARACKTALRDPGDVTLVAVSKTHAAEAIIPLIEAGQRVFGENRVQEAQGKWPALRSAYPDVELHLIGQLQSNKAGQAVALFDQTSFAKFVVEGRDAEQNRTGVVEREHDCDADRDRL